MFNIAPHWSQHKPLQDQLLSHSASLSPLLLNSSRANISAHGSVLRPRSSVRGDCWHWLCGSALPITSHSTAGDAKKLGRHEMDWLQLSKSVVNRWVAHMCGWWYQVMKSATPMIELYTCILLATFCPSISESLRLRGTFISWHLGISPFQCCIPSTSSPTPMLPGWWDMDVASVGGMLRWGNWWKLQVLGAPRCDWIQILAILSTYAKACQGHVSTMGGSFCVTLVMCASTWTLAAFKVPLAAPSANRFGHISPTCPEHVFEAGRRCGWPFFATASAYWLLCDYLRPCETLFLKLVLHLANGKKHHTYTC